jgi:hypothetical protein
MSSADEYWNHLIIVSLRRGNRFFRSLSPLFTYSVMLLGIIVCGWVFCSGIIECSQLLGRYIVPEYQQIANPPINSPNPSPIKSPSLPGINP